MAIELFGDGDADPSFADTVLFNVGSLRSVETDTNIAFQNFFFIVRAIRIDAEPIW